MSGPVYDGYHWLYRVFDAEGRLLYIGRTANPWQRISHQLCSAWRWRDAADRIDWEPIGPYQLADRALVHGRGGVVIAAISNWPAAPVVILVAVLAAVALVTHREGRER